MMGCRICIEAPLEAMPLDLTVLLRSTPSSASFNPYQTIVSPPVFELGDGNLLMETSGPPYACRRVATFPLVNHHRPPKPSSLRYRSLSELTDLKLLTSASKYGAEAFSTLVDSKGNCELLVPNELASDDEQESEQETTTHDAPDSKMVYLVRIRSRSSLSEETPADESEGPVSPNTMLKRLKKKVAFADDRGLQLTTIRVMTEPSDVPPKINYSAIMRQLVGDEWTGDAVAKPCATWVVNFKQPASEYLAFRKKLYANYVALENALVKNDHCRLIGTVKVKNVCFEKQLFVRFTDNEWRSYFDRPCTYLTTKGSASADDSVDTFQFDFEIPCDDSQHQRMEFCICYRTGNGQEFWDNNEGKNFEVISEHLRLQRNQTPQMNIGNGASSNGNGSDEHGKEATPDVMALNCKNWTEFASWSDVSTGDSGYW